MPKQMFFAQVFLCAFAPLREIFSRLRVTFAVEI